jgi:hypothetical protein
MALLTLVEYAIRQMSWGNTYIQDLYTDDFAELLCRVSGQLRWSNLR